MALTRPSLTMQLTSGVNVFTHADKRRTLRTTIVTYSAIWQMTFQFMSNVTEVLDFFLKLPQIRSSNFRQVVRQHTEGTKGSIMWFVGNILFFPVVKEFWKSVKNWQNYCREFGVLLFGDTVYFSPMKNYPRITLPWNIYVRQRPPPPVSPMFLPHETPPPWKFTVTLCALLRAIC